MTPKRDQQRNDRLLRESIDHVVRRDTGQGVEADLAAFAEWRARSAEHETAAARAERLSVLARSVGRALAAEARAEAAPAAMRPNETPPPAQHIAWPGRPVSRRAMIGGAIAASGVAALGIGTQVIPLGGRPDLATGKGERKVLALADGLQVTLDAQSSANVVHAGGLVRIDLLRGRAGIEASMAGGGAVETRAGAGIARAREARYDVRLDGDRGCVTCVEGAVEFRHKDRRLALSGGEALRYDNARVEPPARIDPDVATAWQRGLLVFHSVPLAEVVREVNRYRSGLVVIQGRIADTPVSGVFYIDSIGESVAQIEAITGARAARFPGGLVVLS